MRVVLVHYHLRGGGVTRVLSHQVSALLDRGIEVMTIVGEKPDAMPDFPGRIAVMPELAYNSSRNADDCSGVGERLLELARDELGGMPDVLHVHNHSLGKNAALPTAVHELATAGWPLLLQVHDFAEDWRPRNFMLLRDLVGGGRLESLNNVLYPNTGNVHYALLNRRDAGFIQAAGACPDRVHLLPNAVSFDTDNAKTVNSIEEPLIAGRRLFAYPTRAIRRKNVGEFVLWAALAQDADDLYAVTLAPKNPEEQCFYQPWVEFVQACKLPIVFELMNKLSISFDEMLRRAECVVSTSVTEGFGLAFLEPWLLKRRLAGRNLPEITSEFSDAGLDLTGLYEQLMVPVEWCGGEAEVTNRMACELRRTMIDFGLNFGLDQAQYECEKLICDGAVDLGRLDEALQRQVVQRIINDAGAGDEIRPKRLLEPLTTNEEEKLLQHNFEAVRSAYSLSRYGERLLEIYADVAAGGASAGDEMVDVSRLLDSYLAPARFHMIRS